MCYLSWNYYLGLGSLLHVHASREAETHKSGDSEGKSLNVHTYGANRRVPAADPDGSGSGPGGTPNEKLRGRKFHLITDWKAGQKDKKGRAELPDDNRLINGPAKRPTRHQPSDSPSGHNWGTHISAVTRYSSYNVIR